MELFLPDEISLDEHTWSLIGDVDETARQVNEVRPIPSDVRARVIDDLLADRVYGSNAIEGNTLNRGETLEILQTGHIDIAKKREAIEARNLGRAVGHVAKIVEDQEFRFAADALLQTHAILFAEINDDWAGCYRDQRVKIAGAVHQPPSDDLVPALVERAMTQLQEERTCHGVVLATWAHWAIARIHPFHDGNGRMARLWQDLVLFRRRYTCAIIAPEERSEYLDALRAADEGDFNSFVRLVAARVATTFDRYLLELTKEEEYEAWAGELATKADVRPKKPRDVEYERWSRAMIRLRAEFELTVAKINQKSRAFVISIGNNAILGRLPWQRWHDRSTGPSSQLFFRIYFKHDDGNVDYIFSFHPSELPQPSDAGGGSGKCVSLSVSENIEGVGNRKLDSMLDCPIGVREIFFVDSCFVRRRREINAPANAYDRDIEPSRIAKEFIQDVILHRFP